MTETNIMFSPDFDSDNVTTFTVMLNYINLYTMKLNKEKGETIVLTFKAYPNLEKGIIDCIVAETFFLRPNSVFSLIFAPEEILGNDYKGMLIMTGGIRYIPKNKESFMMTNMKTTVITEKEEPKPFSKKIDLILQKGPENRALMILRLHTGEGADAK